MAVILDITHIAMSKIISGHIIMSGIPENHMVDTKIMNLPIFFRNLYQFNLRPWSKRRPFGIFAFYINTFKNQKSS